MVFLAAFGDSPAPFRDVHIGSSLASRFSQWRAISLFTQDVQAAQEEATDNVRFLKLLRKNLDKLNLLDEFVALVPLFKPVFHTMLLIWKHSKYYNTSARFVTLLQEICNDLIMQVRTGSSRERFYHGRMVLSWAQCSVWLHHLLQDDAYSILQAGFPCLSSFLYCACIHLTCLSETWFHAVALLSSTGSLLQSAWSRLSQVHAFPAGLQVRARA